MFISHNAFDKNRDCVDIYFLLWYNVYGGGKVIMKKRFPIKTLIFFALLFLICLSYFLSGAVVGYPIIIEYSDSFRYLREYNIFGLGLYGQYSSYNWTDLNTGTFRVARDNRVFTVDGIEYKTEFYEYRFPNTDRKRYYIEDGIVFKTLNDILVSIGFSEDPAFTAIPQNEITTELVYSYIEKYCGTTLQAVEGDIRKDYKLNDTAVSWLYSENGEYEYTFVKYVCGKPTAYCIKVVLYETGQLKLIQNGYNSSPILKDDEKYMIPSWMIKNRIHTVFNVTKTFMEEEVKEEYSEELDAGYVVGESYLYKDYERGYTIVTKITNGLNTREYAYVETDLDGLIWRVSIPSVIMLGCVALSTIRIIKWRKKSTPIPTEQEEQTE